MAASVDRDIWHKRETEVLNEMQRKAMTVYTKEKRRYLGGSLNTSDSSRYELTSTHKHEAV